MVLGPKKNMVGRTALVVFLLILVMSPTSVVACFEEGGHSTREFAFHDHCDAEHENDVDGHHGFSSSSQVTSHSHCLDVPLSIELLVGKASDASLGNQTAKIIAFIQPDIEISANRLASDFADDAIISSPHYPPLDAVILLL